MNQPISMVQTLRNRNAELEMQVIDLKRQLAMSGETLRVRKTVTCFTCMRPESICRCGPEADFLTRFSRMPPSPANDASLSRGLMGTAARFVRGLRKLI